MSEQRTILRAGTQHVFYNPAGAETMISKREIRDGFNQMIAAALAAGDYDAVARMEVAREYFSNDQFKVALQDHLYQLSTESVK